MSTKSLQPCLSLCNPKDCSPPGSSVHGILQAKILEWVAIPSSRGSSWPRDRTHFSYISCTGRQILYHQHHLGSPYIIYTYVIRTHTIYMLYTCVIYARVTCIYIYNVHICCIYTGIICTHIYIYTLNIYINIYLYLYIHIYVFFLRFFSIVSYYKILNTVPIHLVLVGWLFYIYSSVYMWRW